MSQLNYITGTTSGTLAAGNDARIVQVAANTTAITKLSLSPTTTKTAAYTAAAQDLVVADATNGAFTVTLPNAPADSTLVSVKKIDAGINIVTVATGGSDTYATGGTSALLSVQGHAATWRYQATGGKWIGVSNDLPLAAADLRYLVQPAGAVGTYVYSTYANAPSLPANSVVISITGA